MPHLCSKLIRHYETRHSSATGTGANYPSANPDETTRQWFNLLQIDPLLQEPLIQLSNGENKRVQLAMALLQQPTLLILDNPFVGLDVKGRQLLHTILEQLANTGMTLLVITTPHEIPGCITHIATLHQGVLTAIVAKKDFQPTKTIVPDRSVAWPALQTLTAATIANFDIAVNMVNVQVQYEGKKILQDLNWTIRKGEHWSLSGPNGAGKSTLLSLLTGDNPQAYSNEIELFDRRRGSGESIWDIKKKIGYVSPELHLYFDYTATCFQAVASGLFDTIGLFRQLSEAEEELVHQWMDLLQLTDHAGQPLSRLSVGEQRLVLLARALVKNPPLLILDEPCQGLDEAHVALFGELVNAICLRAPVTLVYVSHYREEIPACVTKHLYLEKGKATIIQ